MKIGWFFTEIWRYIDFQNGGHPPSWNCFTKIRDHPRSLLLAAAACQISCQSDTQIWRYSYLNFSLRPPKWGFWRTWTHKCDYSSSRPPKGTSLRKSASFKLSTVKIHWGVWPVGELTESATDTHTDRQTDTHSLTHCCVWPARAIATSTTSDPAPMTTASWLCTRDPLPPVVSRSSLAGQVDASSRG